MSNGSKCAARSHTAERAKKLRISKVQYRARMRKFVAAMKPNSIAVIVSNPARTRSNDTHYQYRQSSDVLYLNGFGESDSVLIFSNVGKKTVSLTMLVPPNDALLEQWNGFRAGVEGAKKDYLADEAHPIGDFAKILAEQLEDADHVYYRVGLHDELDEIFLKVWQKYPRPMYNPEDITHEMRMVKSAAEIKIMAEAGRISAEAHCAAMKRSAPGVTEFQLQATMESMFLDQGATAPAYGSIVATGASGWVLHYVSNQGILQDGEMVLIDAACEYQGYASDITRTFPVNGKFSPAQREIYQLVLDAQKAAIKAVKPGVTLAKVHSIAANVLRRGLVKLGILPECMRTARGEKAIKAAMEKKKVKKSLATLATFYPHGTGHWLGLDVHDVGTNGTRSGKAKERPVESGMVFTVEPGLYFSATDRRVPKRYRGIAVRIEDDVLVTEDGHSLLTSGVPKEIEDIEKLMAR